MAVNCGVSFGICAVRLTKVDVTGAVLPPPNNSYVSDKPISIAVRPNIEEGQTFSLRNGCGCSIARFKANDTFNWWEFTFQMGALEPAMLSMLLGTPTIEQGADIVGQAFLGALDCDEAEPAVALEFWTQHIVGSGQDAFHPYIHWVFPKTVWRLGDNTFEEGIAQPTVEGFSRTNNQWGDGPYGDGPPDGQDISEGGWWKTAIAPPTAACAPASVTPSS
ncbi:MAG: hypothetical protein KatS3mg015_2556 [Fimbriimonadales bacterium]|nr:MAG: hypothetical protein KatS3mg015_2556 [Fimbriimonadales bacterium]